MNTDLLDEAGGSVAGLLAASARRWPSMRAVAAGGAPGRSLSFAELDRAVDTRTHELAATGIGSGDPVAMRLPMSVEFVVEFLATVRAGAIAVPLAPQLSPGSVGGLLEHCGATVLISGEFDTGSLPGKVRVVEPGLAREAGADAAVAQPAATGDAPAVIAYAAGVDSTPRAASHSHRALTANVAQLRAVLPHSAAGRERVLFCGPPAHLFSIVAGLLVPLSAGWTVLIPGSPGAREVLGDSAAQRATMLVATPATYAELSALPDADLGEGLATVSRLLCGPTPAHPRAHGVLRRATGLDLVECYGRAEVAGVLSSTLASESAEPGSAGRALPGCELRLVDSAGEQTPVPLDDADPDDVFSEDGTGTGLIAARGPSISAGYWPGSGHAAHPGGWARTGDLGYFDDAGDLHLVDRASDLIVVDGFNVFPHEVEQVIAELPEVADVAVVGVPDSARGEAVHAVVVAAPGASPSEERVLEQCAARLPAYKVPAAVRFAGELPHTPTGMLRRNRVRQ